MRSAVLSLCMLIRLYSWVIFAYVILSWFPRKGALGKIYDALGVVCEPFLKLFRKLIPPLQGNGMAVDFSPIVAFFALQLIEMLIRRLLF